MVNLRLVIDEPEFEPPAPLPFRSWRRPGEDTLDVVKDIERALDRAQESISTLDCLVDEAFASTDPIPFPRRIPGNDDGPWAA